MYSIIINELENLNNARSLLYSYYLEHLAWKITYNNPSGIKIQEKNNQTIISDDYDDLSIWFSVSNNENLISCGRLCQKDSNGLLEIERYPNAKNSLQDILKKKNELNIVELNREAVLPMYVDNTKPYLLLLASIFQYCLDNNNTILTTSNLPEWVNMYDRIGFQRLDYATFKYFDHEPEPVKVYFACANNIKNMLVTIDGLLNK